MKSRSRLILLAIAGLAVTALVLSLRDGGVPVQTHTVVRGPLETQVVREGVTRVLDRYVVAAPVSGMLSRIQVDSGDWVETGLEISQIRPAPTDVRSQAVLAAQLEAARAQEAVTAAQVDDARLVAELRGRDLQRAEALARDSIISRQELEATRQAALSAENAVQALSAATNVARANVEAARQAHSGSAVTPPGAYTPVRVPAAGRVLRVHRQSAGPVAAGSPLIEIGDAAGLEVVVDVLSQEAVGIATGADVRIERWGGDQVLRGRVRQVEPEAFTKISTLGVEEQRVSVIVDLLERPETLGAGYRVEARIVTWRHEDVLLVPTSAIFRLDGAWRTFVIREGRAYSTVIELAHRSETAAEVVGGLSSGDILVVFPSSGVIDGGKVAF